MTIVRPLPGVGEQAVAQPVKIWAWSHGHSLYAHGRRVGAGEIVRDAAHAVDVLEPGVRLADDS